MQPFNHSAIKQLSNADLPSLSSLHYQVLPGEFLTSISPTFLTGFYQILFQSKYSHFLGILACQGQPLATRQGLPLAAAIVCLEEKYHPTLKTYFQTAVLFIQNTKYFILKPKLILLFIQSFLFKLHSPQDTEIFFIGVHPKYQKQGLGKKLIQALEKKLSKNYDTLYVDCKCKLPSNNFYQKQGFTTDHTFKLYGEKWNRYQKNLKFKI